MANHMGEYGIMVPPPPPMVASMPLPPGWEQHMTPDGNIPYYYNTVTQESTYVRPLPPPPPGFPGAAPMNGMAPAPASSSSEPPAKKAKKEKAKEKIPIPGTSWIKVITSEGNVFYTEKTSKRSSWTIPDEIADAVAAYEEATEREEIRRHEEELERQRAQEEKERERVRLEKERERQIKEQRARERAQVEQDAHRKRKELERLQAAQAEEEDARPAKMAKRESAQPEAEPEAAQEEDSEDEGQAGPIDEEDEEAWQKAVAAEIAAEHAASEKIKKAEKKAAREEQEAAKATVFAAPTKVELTPEEGRALFKALLYEKDISPFAPWDTSLPLFINDPRYVLLASQKDRKEVFEEYCREAARSRRMGKPEALKRATDKDPEKEYRALLAEEVKSTRTIWDEFKRSFKKDRRFWSYGKDDRAREKLFRSYLKELGEKKRASAKAAEANFLQLLSEHGNIGPEAEWKEVKQGMVSDPRYDAVGSSSLRESLFNQYKQGLARRVENGVSSVKQEDLDKKMSKEERAKASLQARERAVRDAQQQASRDLQRSRYGAEREEGEREYGSLLVQAVREHTVKWQEILPQLQADPRFSQNTLSMVDKERLFRNHLDGLARKRLDALHAAFAKHATSMTTAFDEIFPDMVEEFDVKRLNLSSEALQDKYETWQRVRYQKAQQDFEAMLRENSFVDFWGRMKKKQLDEAAMAIKDEEEDEEEDVGAGGGGRASLADMAKQIDLGEVQSVLQNDARYRIFDHVADQREQWIKDYLDQLHTEDSSIHRTG